MVLRTNDFTEILDFGVATHSHVVSSPTNHLLWNKLTWRQVIFVLLYSIILVLNTCLKSTREHLKFEHFLGPLPNSQFGHKHNPTVYVRSALRYCKPPDQDYLHCGRLRGKVETVLDEAINPGNFLATLKLLWKSDPLLRQHHASKTRLLKSWLGDIVRSTILSDIRQAKCYTIMVDEVECHNTEQIWWQRPVYAHDI